MPGVGGNGKVREGEVRSRLSYALFAITVWALFLS